MTRHGDQAAAYFMQGYNCAQSTAATFAEDFGLDVDLVLRMTAGFGGGMGGLRGTCGAVSAMALVAGLHAGSYAPDDRPAKEALYALVRRMHQEFIDRHGTTSCAELLGQAGVVLVPDPAQRDAEYYAARPCARLVASAAEIIAEALGIR